MKIEYEVKILEIDQEEMILKLEKLGAILEGNWLQKRKIYDFNPVQESKWIRLRTNGVETTLTIKDVTEKTIDGTKELEIKVSSFEDTDEILKELGYVSKIYQENKRIRYRYQNIEIDIDTWPLIPTYVEIEGKSKEEIESFLTLIDYDATKLTTKDVKSIYKEFYNIDLDYRVLTFKEQIR